MCIPVAALAVASLVATAAGGVVSYMGQQQAASSEAAQLTYNAQVANNNAILKRQDQARITAETDVAAQRQQQETAAAVSRARVAAAGGGVDPNSGSALDLQADLTKIGKLDETTTRYNGLILARNAGIEASNFDSQRGLLTSQAKGVKKAGQLAGYASLLSTASSIGDKYMSFKSAGTF
jgi:hypothetical protein